MTFVEVALVLIYTSVLLIKACDVSSEVCSQFGFGSSSSGAARTAPLPCVKPPPRPSFKVRGRKRMPWRMVSVGVYLFFLFFGLAMVLLQLLFAAARLYAAGYIPRIILVAATHSVSPTTVIQNVIARRHAGSTPYSARGVNGRRGQKGREVGGGGVDGARAEE